jgi:hypothetical protein
MKKVNKWRDNKVANGWRIIYRVVPEDLFVEIKKLIAKHKGDNYQVWTSLPKE